MLPKNELEELLYLREKMREIEMQPLHEAFRQLDKVLDRPNSFQFDAIMPVVAYRILANAVIALKDEFLKDKS